MRTLFTCSLTLWTFCFLSETFVASGKLSKKMLSRKNKCRSPTSPPPPPTPRLINFFGTCATLQAGSGPKKGVPPPPPPWSASDLRHCELLLQFVIWTTFHLQTHTASWSCVGKLMTGTQRTAGQSPCILMAVPLTGSNLGGGGGIPAIYADLCFLIFLQILGQFFSTNLYHVW